MEGLLGKIRAARNLYDVSYILTAATASLRHITSSSLYSHRLSTPLLHHITSYTLYAHRLATPSLRHSTPNILNAQHYTTARHITSHILPHHCGLLSSTTMPTKRQDHIATSDIEVLYYTIILSHFTTVYI